MPTAKCWGRRRTSRVWEADERAVDVRNPVGVDIHTPTAAVGVQTPVGVEAPTNGRHDGAGTAVSL